MIAVFARIVVGMGWLIQSFVLHVTTASTRVPRETVPET
jgi:hypothetical protein